MDTRTIKKSRMINGFYSITYMKSFYSRASLKRIFSDSIQFITNGDIINIYTIAKCRHANMY